MSREPNQKRVKIPAIDVLRGLAALGVVWYHSRVDLWVGFNKIQTHRDEFSELDRMLSWASLPVSQLGSLVMLFFVLSGFCIHLPLAGKDQQVELTPYFIRRFFRIYPAYLVTLVFCYLAMTFLALWFGGEPPNDQSYWLSAVLLQNWLSESGQIAMNPSLWSIPVELEFYLVYPLLLLIYVRYGFRASLWFTLACTAVGWAMYFRGLQIAAGSFFKYAVIWNSGAWLAEYYVRNALPSWTKWHTCVISLAICLTPSLGLAGIDHFYLDYGWGLISLLLLWWLVSEGSHWLPEEAGWLKPFTALGTISYSLYLIHFPLFKIIETFWLEAFQSKPESFSVPTLFTLVAIPFAWGFYRVFERPSHLWARHLARRREGHRREGHGTPALSLYSQIHSRQPCVPGMGVLLDQSKQINSEADASDRLPLRTVTSQQQRGNRIMHSKEMNIVLLTHPNWMQSASMPRLARMFGDGMTSKGHCVSYWTAKSFFGRLPMHLGGLRKWLGYLDQYLIYPLSLSRKVRKEPDDTIFVVTDQALGMWVPKIKDRPHVIHCNDFLALKSALNEFPENPTKWSGKIYQHLIRRGFSKGAHFVSISHATNQDLKKFTLGSPQSAEAVHLGLNGNFRQLDRSQCIETLKSALEGEEDTGMLIHVGGSQWYKNRPGVLNLYREWASQTKDPIPLWMVGSEPEATLRAAAQGMPNGGTVRFLTGLSNEEVIAAYNLSTLLLFPSLEEGFGWPIAEAMACGTLVLTTDAAPMTEVGGDAAAYLRRWLATDSEWARDGATLIESLVTLSESERQERVQRGLEHASNFKTKTALDTYERIYQRVLNSWNTQLERAQ